MTTNHKIRWGKSASIYEEDFPIVSIYRNILKFLYGETKKYHSKYIIGALVVWIIGIFFLFPKIKNGISPSIIVENTGYSKEWKDVYQRAHTLGITSAPTIEDANLKGVLYRKISAKMFSEFAIQVAGLTPDTTKKCEFKDIHNEIKELQKYIKLSCQLGIMGVDYYWNPDTIFNPNYFVTRDQLVTMLSRILFGDIYNIQEWELTFSNKARNFFVHTLTNIRTALWLNFRISTPLDWYTKHLEVIKKLWLMTDYTPTLKEYRIYVIIILYKLDQMGIKKINSLMETGTNILL